MKTLKLFLTMLILTISLSSMYASNYQTVYSHRIAFFDNKAIRIDSLEVVGNDSVFYPIKSIRENGYYGYYCYTPFGASFLGEKVVIKDNWNYFFNGNGDSIKIKTDAALNESFELFHIENLVTAVATVVSIETQHFFGLSDLVKTIKIELFDKDGNPINHPNINEDPEIKISENYGFLQVFDIYDFYFIGSYYPYAPIYEKRSLIGLTNPDVGRQNLTWFDVFDFQIGDELHIIEEDGEFASPYHRTIQIIDKYQNRTDYGNDSISYEILRIQHTYLRNYAGEETEYTNSQNVTCTYKPNPEFDRLNGEPIIIYDNYGGSYAYANLESSSSKIDPGSEGHIYYQGNDECWTKHIYDGCPTARIYYKGLGGPYSWSCYGMMYTYEKELVYYKKGNETWGNPIVLSINDAFVKEKNLIVNNPTKEFILLNKDMIEHPCLFELIDISGKVLLQKTVDANNNTVNVNHIQNGMYLCRLIKNNNVVCTGKVIKQ